MSIPKSRVSLYNSRRKDTNMGPRSFAGFSSGEIALLGRFEVLLEEANLKFARTPLCIYRNVSSGL